MGFVWLGIAFFLGVMVTSSYDYEVPFVLAGCVFCVFMAIRSFRKGGGSGKASASKSRTTTVQQAAAKPEPKPTPKPEPKPAQEPAKPKGKFCRHCGAKVGPDDIYCIECGNRVQQ